MLFFDKFYSAVLGTAFVRAVGGDGLVGALADSGKAGFGDALFNQGGYDSFGPFWLSGSLTLSLPVASQ